jgi:hypothetical protein
MTKPMRKRTFVSWLFAGAALLVLTPFFTVAARSSSRESVRSELIRLQHDQGLTLAWIDGNSLGRAYLTHSKINGVQAISFEKRALVHLQDSLEAFRPEGFDAEKYPGQQGIGGCWSHDQTSLAAAVVDHSSGDLRLKILDAQSHKVRAIATAAEQERLVTEACWSPDDRKLVYETGTDVMVFNFEDGRSDALAKGTDPTWSPDGMWIAFRVRDTYYAIHPDGSGRKKLFHQRGAVSALYWSPDSRIVAYVRELGFLQGGAFDAEVNQLRVRRLEDGSEDWLCRESVDLAGYRWITNPNLRNLKP